MLGECIIRGLATRRLNLALRGSGLLTYYPFALGLQYKFLRVLLRLPVASRSICLDETSHTVHHGSTHLYFNAGGTPGC